MNGQRMENEDCALLKRKLDAYIDGELNEKEVLNLRAHAEACEACGVELVAAETLSKALAALDEGVVMPLSGQAAWRDAVREMARRRNRVGNVVRAFVSAAASLAVLVAGTAYLRTWTDVAPENYAKDAATRMAFVDAATDAPNAKSLPMDPWVSAYVQTDGSPEAAEDMSTKGAPEQKMVLKRAERAIDTHDFDADAENVKDLVREYGGYFVETSVSGAAADAARIGSFSVRIPAKQLSDFLTALSGVGETVFEGEAADDVYAEYVDVESKLATMGTQLSRLNDLMEESGTLSDIISIEEKIAEVQGEIDRLEAQRSGYVSEHDESRVFITLTERAASLGDATLVERMTNGFNASLTWFGGFLRDMAVALAYAAPVLAVVIPLVVIVGAIVHVSRRKYR